MTAGEYWPDGGRFGVMCISGYPDAAGAYDRNNRLGAAHGFSFWVVDLAEMGQEVRRFKAVGLDLSDPRVLIARERACTEADRLNRRDAKVAA